MNLTILGVEPKSFTNKETGELVELVTLHTGQKKDGVEGCLTDKVNLTTKKYNEFGSFKAGQVVNVYYNKYGKVELVQLVK